MIEQYRKSPRASFLNYGEGDYFITICTKNKVHYFGEIRNGIMYKSEIGMFADKQLELASEYCDIINVPLYIIMPNHIHAIVCVRINKSDDCCNENIQQRNPNPMKRNDPAYLRHVPVLSRFVSSLKGAVTKHAKTIGIEFAWQGRYHDHLIRGNHDGNMIVDYIRNNVTRWEQDCLNTIQFYKDTP